MLAKTYPIVSLMICMPGKISYHIVNDKMMLINIISLLIFFQTKLSYHIINDISWTKIIVWYQLTKLIMSNPALNKGEKDTQGRHL